MAHDPKVNPLGWTTDVVDGKEISFVFSQAPSCESRCRMEASGRPTAPPEGLAFVSQKDFDEIEGVNKALKGQSN